MNKFNEYLKLARLHSSVLSGVTPVLGAIAVGVFDIVVFVILFIIGICTHIFGFVFNEYMDVDIDRRAKYLSEKPLVKGTISGNAALAFAVSAVIFGYILVGYLIISYSTMSLMVIMLYTFSWLSIGIYDLTSKYVRGSDLALASWTMGLCLFGGFAAGGNPNRLLFIIAGLAFIQLFIQNIIAGLKDITQDKFGQGTTTPLRMGVTFKKNRLFVSVKFQVYIYLLKFIHMVLVFIPFLVFWLNINFIQILIIMVFIIINFLLVNSIFTSARYQRGNLLRKIGLHEILSYSIVPVMFYGIIGILDIIFLIILPIVWLALFMRIMYGRLLPNI